MTCSQKDMTDFLKLAGLIAIAAIWGGTNPLLKKYSAGIEDIQQSGFIKQVCFFGDSVFLKVDPRLIRI